MYFADFYKKLKKLNPRLWIDCENVTYATNQELGSCGIYLKEKDETPLYDLGGETQKGVQRYNTRNMVYLGWVTHFWIPERNQYKVPENLKQYQGAKLTAPGWRETLLKLVSARHIKLETARKVFDCPSLGRDDWDNLDHEEKVFKLYGDQVYDKLNHYKRKLKKFELAGV